MREVLLREKETKNKVKKILVIDDDKLLGITIQRLLSLENYNVVYVDNGGDAIEKIKEQKFDLIISDIRMTGLDGIETIKRIRRYLKEKSQDPIPEILITGFADDDSYKEGRKIGVADFIYKPFDVKKFIQIVKRVLSKPAISFERRKHSRIKASLPVYLEVDSHLSSLDSKLTGETIDISEEGMGVLLKNKLTPPLRVKIHILSTANYPDFQTKAEIVWSDSDLQIEEKTGETRCGFHFLKIEDKTAIKEFLYNITIYQINKFFGVNLPEHIKKICWNNYLFEKFDQKQIMGVIDFTPPFLKIQKIVVLSKDRRDLLQTKSLSMGFITPRDTAGHYNETIFLAMCGWLMASSASVFLAILFPTTAPQVVEANGIKPLPILEEKGLWKPAPKGTIFFVESTIIKKKMQLVIMRTTISFNNIFYGVIEELKLMLTPKGSIWSAKPVPPLEIYEEVKHGF